MQIVRKALADSGARDLACDPVDFAIQIGSIDQTIYLDNAFSDYSSAARNERDGVLRRYVESFLFRSDIPKNFAVAASSLMPVVRDPSYFGLTAVMFRAKGRDPAGLEVPRKVIGDGLVAALAFDAQHKISTVNGSKLEEWGISFEDALRAAVANLRERTDPTGIKQLAPGLFAGQWGDSYESARLLLPDLLYRLPLNGDPVIFVPNRNQLWVTGQYDSAAITAILTDAKQNHFGQGHPLSPNLYLRTGDYWRLFVPEEGTQKRLWEAIKYQREATDYAQQKKYLDKAFQKEGTDIFVASYALYKRPDESLFSRCVWTRGVDSLLPKTDLIVLLIDPNKKESVEVPFQSVSAIAAPLMQQVPGLIPLRYRVRTFPRTEQLAALKSVSYRN